MIRLGHSLRLTDRQRSRSGWTDPLAGMPGLYSWSPFERNGQPYGLFTGVSADIPATADGDVVTGIECFVTGLKWTQLNSTLAMTLRNEGGHWVLEGGSGKYYEAPSAMLGMARNIAQFQVWVALRGTAISGNSVIFAASVAASTIARVGIRERSGTASVAQGCRLDSDSLTSSTVSRSVNTWLVLSAEADFNGGTIRIKKNNVPSTSASFSSGGGLSQDDDSQTVRIGRPVDSMPGYISGFVIAQSIPDSTWQATVQQTLEDITP